MAAGKWISDLTADTSVDDAARRVLGLRLEAVRDHLGLALREPEKDPEHVHQLRVATRRAGAALKIFRDNLPDKIHRTARKELRRLRRSAGAARDWDVFLQDLVEELEQRPSRQRPGLDYLIGYASGQRLAAQPTLEEAAGEYPFDLDRLHAEVLAEIDSNSSDAATLLNLAIPVLSDLLQKLDLAASVDLSDYGHLHQVRILGKRLRYAMEVFADCFASAFREVHYAAIEEMQDILGRANDSHVANQRLTTLAEKVQLMAPQEWKRYRPGFEALLKFHRERLPAERQHFEKWWAEWQKSGGEQAFRALLRPATSAAG